MSVSGPSNLLLAVPGRCVRCGTFVEYSVMVHLHLVFCNEYVS